MIRFTTERVLLLHQLMIAQTGGSDGLRDMGLLESAVESIYASFGGQELYPSKQEKGARLGYALIANHAFIGMYAMLTFLEVNGIRLSCRNDEVVKVGLGIASGAMKYEDVLTWVNEHQI